MRMERYSAVSLCRLAGAGTLVTMAAVTAGIYLLTADKVILRAGAALTVCALAWMFLLVRIFERRLSGFSEKLCGLMDEMIDSSTIPAVADDRETLFSKISHRLVRLCGVMKENREQALRERRELQALVTDISHQVRTPVSNLKMMSDTLLEKPVGSEEREEFLRDIRGQVEKLDFLIQAMVKSSRLETGMVCLAKKDACLYETLAQAMSGIVYFAEKKGLHVEVSCPEDLVVSHDGKWTAEALYNLLDNAVKYTPPGGKVSVSVEQWEMYVKVDVADTGRGIPEDRQAAVFRRFYREEEVHAEPGAGVGLYLSRQIIARQGGYIKLTSEAGKGSTFSVFLPVQ